jgi:hypothetical protein
MPLIKTITEGETVKVVVKDGKVSCTCCCNCGGLASESEWPGTLRVQRETLLMTSSDTFKISACVWATPATYPAVFWTGTEWQTHDFIDTGLLVGHRAAACSAGPIGQYFSMGGMLLFTVTEVI